MDLHTGVVMLRIRGKFKESKDSVFWLSSDSKKLHWGKQKTRSDLLSRSFINLRDIQAIYVGQGTKLFAETVELDATILNLSPLSWSLIHGEGTLDGICDDIGQLRGFIAIMEKHTGRKAKPPPKPVRVFGMPLDPKSFTAPIIVLKLTDYIYRHGTQTTGIFRLSGSQDEINFLRKEFDAGQDPDLDAVCDDVNAVAGLYKLYLRQMPEPLLTHEFYGLFVAVQGIPDEEVKLQRVSKLLDMLPPVHLAILDVLIGLLNKISQYADVNMMNAANLAVVIMPNILRSAEEEEGDVSLMVEDMPLATALVETLIVNYDMIFMDYHVAMEAKRPPTPPPKPKRKSPFKNRPVPPPKPSVPKPSQPIGVSMRAPRVPPKPGRQRSVTNVPVNPRHAAKWDPSVLSSMLDERTAVAALERRKEHGRDHSNPR